jgi:hypothetical protein
MINLSLSQGDAWLFACAFAANFVIGIYHLMVVFDTIKFNANVRPGAAILLGLVYASPPVLLALTVARFGHII